MDAAVIRKSFCYFPLLFLLLFVLLPGLTVTVTVLILHPQKPVFSIKTVKLESYKLDVVESGKEIFVSSLLSFNLSAANRNKVGISYYATSRLHILDQDDGITVGMIRIPRFYQPPKSKDVSVAAQVIFGCVNLTRILSGKLMLQQDKASDENSLSQMRILGDVRAQVRLFHLPLPKFRVSLDCDITIDRRYLTSLNMAKNQMISLPSNSNLLFNRCSMALYL